MAGEILSVGEVLWDSLPDGLFLGGAPFNVACHLHALGEPVAFASRVGDDELGREILRRMERQGLDPGLIQVDRELETGFVVVKLDAKGSPTFQILEPSAWDAMEPAAPLLEAARTARALVHGSLALRRPATRDTLRRIFETGVPRAFDVNLRPPFVDRAIVEECLKGARIVKLNDQEWTVLSGWFGLSGDLRRGSEALAARFGIETVCITRGAAGAALRHRGGWHEHPGFRVHAVDAVGSGDAFLAALLSGLLRGKDPALVLEEANALGAFVATRRGATPPSDPGEVAKIRGAAARP